MMNYKQANISNFELKQDDTQGIFEGYASVFGNEDLGGDIVEQGAFKSFKTTKSGHIRLTLGHDLNRICGKCTFKQDDKGLFVKGQLNLKTRDGNDAYELLKDGTIDELSFGYVADECTHTEDHVRLIKSLTIYEVALVPFAMNPKSKITDVKQNIPSIRIAEKVLTEHCGYSKKEAKTILSRKRDACGQRDADIENTLNNHLNTLKEKQL